jgi:lysophosphatidate acyltransferase
MSLGNYCCDHCTSGSVVLGSYVFGRLCLRLRSASASASTLHMSAVAALMVLALAYAASPLVIAIPSVLQERRIWKSPLLPSLNLFGAAKVYLFNVLWMSGALAGSILLLPKYILGKFLGFDTLHEAHYVERILAKACCICFVCPAVEIRGEENLPADDGSSPAPVYVANHCSQVDLAVVYFLGRRFRWIAKHSVKFLPGVGLIMTLNEHVFIRRTGKNKKSISNLFEKSNRAIQSGLPMFFFPQGTRRMAGRLPFKDGAYTLALDNKSQLIPVSIEIPLSCWNSWYPLCLLWGESVSNVVLTVHKPVQATEGMDKEALKKETFGAIFSVIPLIGDEVNEPKKEK